MAKPRTGTSKKRSTPSGKRTATGATQSACVQAREIEGSDSVLVVQFSEPHPIPPGDIETFVVNVIGHALAKTKTRPSGRKAWLFFLATERAHATGQHSWLGVGPGVPAKFLDAIQAGLEAHGCRASREHAVIAHHALRPLLALTADGVEVPIGATSPNDTTLGRLADQITRKPFAIGLNDLYKKDLLGSLLLGDDRPFQLRYFHDDSLATLSFGRIDLQMFAQHGDGTYTGMSKFSATPPCVVGFDFDGPQLSELLLLLPEQTGQGLINALMQGRPFRVQPGSVVIGVVAWPAPPDGSGATTFVVDSFTPACDADLAAHF